MSAQDEWEQCMVMTKNRSSMVSCLVLPMSEVVHGLDRLESVVLLYLPCTFRQRACPDDRELVMNIS